MEFQKFNIPKFEEADIERDMKDLFDLSDRIACLKERIAKDASIDFTAQDSRLIALDAMQRAILACGFWFNAWGLIYRNIMVNHQDESKIPAYIGSNLTFEQTAEIMMDHLRFGLVVFPHFKLEMLLGCLLREISGEKPQGITAIFDKLSEEIELNNALYKKDVIKAFSSVRNSLHNNGTHKKDTFSVRVKGLDYKFEKDGVVQCASLPHSIKLIQEITDIISEILETERIKEIKGIIPDTFTEWLQNQGAQ